MLLPALVGVVGGILPGLLGGGPKVNVGGSHRVDVGGSHKLDVGGTHNVNGNLNGNINHNINISKVHAEGRVEVRVEKFESRHEVILGFTSETIRLVLLPAMVFVAIAAIPQVAQLSRPRLALVLLLMLFGSCWWSRAANRKLSAALSAKLLKLKLLEHKLKAVVTLRTWHGHYIGYTPSAQLALSENEVLWHLTPALDQSGYLLHTIPASTGKKYYWTAPHSACGPQIVKLRDLVDQPEKKQSSRLYTTGTRSAADCLIFRIEQCGDIHRTAQLGSAIIPKHFAELGELVALRSVATCGYVSPPPAHEHFPQDWSLDCNAPCMGPWEGFEVVIKSLL